MPELPEVETVCRGIAPHVTQAKVTDVTIRKRELRWPIPRTIKSILKSQVINEVSRRGKYILLHFNSGTLLVHLGMSGTLKIVKSNTPVIKHDHADIHLSNNLILRFNDPRRFGSILWSKHPVEEHELLAKLGPEPLESSFDYHYLYKKLQSKKSSIKVCIMNSHLVVGVGNIYANEALFDSGIHPLRLANTLTEVECKLLCKNIKKVLKNAIQKGGTTLKDFTNSEGKPGYFAQVLNVYGRGGESCNRCSGVLTEERVGARSTVFCENCQN